jgi:methylmalonyl-CoA epimerase
LLHPVRDDSTVAKYLANKGEGLHHIGYRVDDCAAALERVKALGFRAIDEQPRPGSRGTTVAFLHPKTAFGTLIELVQE